MASCWSVMRRPSTTISPVTGLRRPKIASAISVLPLPMMPARPTISPAWISKLTSATRGGSDTPLTFSTGSPRVSTRRSCHAKALAEDAPSMFSTSSGIVRLAQARVTLASPSRITVTRSQSWKISAMRCEM